MLWKRLKAKLASAAHPKLKFEIAEKLPGNLLIVVFYL
jgi:hypothetical protein